MDWTAAATILTSGILAFAALLAYAVQRANYLRSIEPDIEIVGKPRITVGRLESSLKEFWHLQIELDLHNRSRNRAEDVTYDCELRIFPKRGGPGGARSLGSRIPAFSRIGREILPGRRMLMEVHVGWNGPSTLYQRIHDFEGPLTTEDVGLMADITVRYATPSELVLWVMAPWGGGRKRYRRRVQMSWGFVRVSQDPLAYQARKWVFAKPELEGDDDRPRLW